MAVDSVIHRPIEDLPCLDPTIEEPTPTGTFLDMAVGRLMFPKHMTPEDGLMKRRRFPNRARVNSIVEEQHQRTAPISPHRQWRDPTARPLHLMRCEVQCIDLRLGQVVPTRNITLLPGLGKTWQSIDEVLFPRPRHHRAQVLPSLVRSAAWVRPFLLEGVFMNPVQESTDIPPRQFLDGNAFPPALPLPQRGDVFVLRSAGEISSTHVAIQSGLKCCRHRCAPGPPTRAPMPNPNRR